MIAPPNDKPVARRILVVEDTMLVADEIVFILSQLGFDVVGPFSQVRDALKAIDREHIDGGLLDVNLGGGETAYQVANTLIERGTPFVFMTGYDVNYLEPAFRLSPCLSKPFDAIELEAELDRMFADRHAPSAASTPAAHEYK